jgi:hypothetical protein
MDALKQRTTEVRAEIERLKSALLTTTNETERFEVRARLNACIRKSLGLIEQCL